MLRPARLPALATSLALLAPAAVRGDSRSVYRRATPTDALTGVIELRTVDEPIVEVPADCPGQVKGSLGCREERRFPRVYVLEFLRERRVAQRGEPRVEIEPRGRVSLFLHFDAADRAGFDEELRRGLAGLAADAFAQSFAGLRPATGVFSSIAVRSREPSWSCFADATSRQVTRHERYTERGADGTLQVTGSGQTGHSADEITTPLCRAGPALADSIAAEEIRTMPVARTLMETTVEVAIADGLQETSYADQLAVLPRDQVYTVERDPGVIHSESVHTTDERVRASYSAGEVKISATAEPAPLATEAVSNNSWLAQWTVETVERRMGPAPSEELVELSVLHTALLPTLPPVALDEQAKPIASAPSETYAIDLDATAFLDEIGQRLDREATIDARSLEDAVALHPAGLGSQGWLLVVCRPEGSADYRLLPTSAKARVGNADAFCAAVERQLAAAGIRLPGR